MSTDVCMRLHSCVHYRFVLAQPFAVNLVYCLHTISTVKRVKSEYHVRCAFHADGLVPGPHRPTTVNFPQTLYNTMPAHLRHKAKAFTLAASSLTCHCHLLPGPEILGLAARVNDIQMHLAMPGI